MPGRQSLGTAGGVSARRLFSFGLITCRLFQTIANVSLCSGFEVRRLGEGLTDPGRRNHLDAPDPKSDGSNVKAFTARMHLTGSLTKKVLQRKTALIPLYSAMRQLANIPLSIAAIVQSEASRSVADFCTGNPKRRSSEQSPTTWHGLPQIRRVDPTAKQWRAVVYSKVAMRQRIRDVAASRDLSDEEIKPALRLKHEAIGHFCELQRCEYRMATGRRRTSFQERGMTQ